MSLEQNLYTGLKRIIAIEDRVVRLPGDMKRLRLVVPGHGERLALLEREIELLEATAPARRRK